MLVCPLFRVRVASWAEAIICSKLAKIAPLGPNESKAPAFAKLSRVRRLRLVTSARWQNSSIDLKMPFSLRSSTTGRIEPSPTFLIADNPNRKTGVDSVSLSIVKNSSE